MTDQALDTGGNDAVERRKDVDKEPLSASFWLGEIKAAHKRSSRWYDRAEKVIARYRDERTATRGENAERRANILWSNTETLKSALFQGLGKPDVRRRFNKSGQEDRAARQAALVMERGLTYCADAYDAESQIEAALEDRLLPGRGQSWVVYEAETNDAAPAEAEDDDEENGIPVGADAPVKDANLDAQNAYGGSEISTQSVRIDHIYWRDFLTSAGRKWSNVWWVSRAHDYSRDELITYWPKHGKEIPLTSTVQGFESDARKSSKEQVADSFMRGRVWEIWDKSKRQRVYVAEGYKHVLQSDDDPYRLEHFFPCPEPLWGTKTTSSLDPIPDYMLYQDQAEELDTVQTRLARQIDALRRRGVYDASADGADNQLARLAHAGDNEFLPYRNFAVLSEKGGLKNVFQTEDLQPIIEVVGKLQEHRQLLIQTIYEITGISDIMRGSTDAGETATAQRIKGQFGSMRMQRQQKKVQLFIRALFRLKAEIMAEHFTREQLQEMTGIDMPTKAEQQQAQAALGAIEAQMKQAQAMAQQGMGAVQVPQIDPKVMQHLTGIVKAVSWEDVSGILRSDKRRGYRVDIDTDSLSRVDDQDEKAQRIEYLGAMQNVLEKAVPMVMQFPPLAPLLKEVTSFTAGAFKAGRLMEETLEDAFQSVEEMAKANMAKGPAQDPEEKKIMMEAKAREAEFQFKAKESEQERQLKQQEMTHNAGLEERRLAHEMAMKEKEFEAERILNENRMAAEQQFKAAEFDRQQAMHQDQRQADHERASWDQHFKQQEFEREGQNQEQTRQFAQKQHDDKMGFDRMKHGADIAAAPVGEGGSTLGSLIETIHTSNQTQAQAYMAAMEQQAQILAQALERIAEQNAQALKVATASKRLIKDPKTGEKRVEVVMQ